MSPHRFSWSRWREIIRNTQSLIPIGLWEIFRVLGFTDSHYGQIVCAFTFSSHYVSYMSTLACFPRAIIQGRTKKKTCISWVCARIPFYLCLLHEHPCMLSTFSLSLSYITLCFPCQSNYMIMDIFLHAFLPRPRIRWLNIKKNVCIISIMWWEIHKVQCIHYLELD